MTTTPDAQTIVEPVAPSRPEAVPETRASGVDGHGRSKTSPRRWWQRRESENPWREEILMSRIPSGSGRPFA